MRRKYGGKRLIMGKAGASCFRRIPFVDASWAASRLRRIPVLLQAITAWSKPLYPEDARGQFEGIRILFFVLIPMIIAPLISNPIIKRSGEFVDENGFTEYLPTHTLLITGAVLVLLTFLPLIPAWHLHGRKRQ